MNTNEKHNLETLMKSLSNYIKDLEKQVEELKNRLENANYIADSYQELFHLERKRNEELQHDFERLYEISKNMKGDIK